MVGIVLVVVFLQLDVIFPTRKCSYPLKYIFILPSAGILFWWIDSWCLLPSMVMLQSLVCCMTGLTVQLLLSLALPWLPWWFSLVLHLLLALWSWEINKLHPYSLVSVWNHVAATVCYFTENFVFLTAMVETHYDGTKFLDWAVVLTSHLHCWWS